MPGPSPSAQEQRRARQTARARREAIAFRNVLGTEGNRSEDQKIVMDALARMSSMVLPVFKPLSGPGGIPHYDPIRAALTEGGRQLFLNVINIINAPFQLPEDTPPTQTTHEEE